MRDPVYRDEREPFRPRLGDTWVVGGKQYMLCGGCGRVVRINKPLLGGLHVCAPEEDR